VALNAADRVIRLGFCKRSAAELVRHLPVFCGHVERFLHQFPEYACCGSNVCPWRRTCLRMFGKKSSGGAEGVVYENLDEPGWVVKVFHASGTSPFGARNEFQNLENARAIRPDNVVSNDPVANERMTAQEPASYARQQGVDLEPIRNDSMFCKGPRWVFLWRKRHALPCSGPTEE